MRGENKVATLFADFSKISHRQPYSKVDLVRYHRVLYLNDVYTRRGRGLGGYPNADIGEVAYI